jgi:hypothetical protein
MMKTEALRLALEALEAIHTQGDVACVVTPNGEIYIQPVITAIKAALEAKDEPVAWYDSVSGWTDFHSFKPTRKPSSPSAEWLPLYATPPQRKPLTDEEIDQICGDVGYGYINVARAIEAAHQIYEVKK